MLTTGERHFPGGWGGTPQNEDPPPQKQSAPGEAEPRSSLCPGHPGAAMAAGRRGERRWRAAGAILSGAERGPSRPVLCLPGRPRPRRTRRCRPSGAESQPQRHCRLQPAMAGEPCPPFPPPPAGEALLFLALREQPRRRLPRAALPSARRGHCSRLPPAVTSIPAPPPPQSRPPSPHAIRTHAGLPLSSSRRWLGAPRQPPPCSRPRFHLGRAVPAPAAPPVPPLLTP